MPGDSTPIAIAALCQIVRLEQSQLVTEIRQELADMRQRTERAEYRVPLLLKCVENRDMQVQAYVDEIEELRHEVQRLKLNVREARDDTDTLDSNEFAS